MRVYITTILTETSPALSVLKIKNFPAERETFLHFFWYCPVVNNILIAFFHENFRIEVNRREYFLGCRNEDDFNDSLMIVLTS
jgi:hypothetical protein